MYKKQTAKTLIGNLTQVNLPVNTSQKFSDFTVSSNLDNFDNGKLNSLKLSDKLNYVFFGIKTRRYTMNIGDFFEEISENPHLVLQMGIQAKANASYIDIPQSGEFFYKLAGEESLNSLYLNLNPKIPLANNKKREVIYGYDDDFLFNMKELKWRIQNISSYLKLDYKERKESKLQDIVMVPETEMSVTEKIYPNRKKKDYQFIDLIANLNISLTSKEENQRNFSENYSLRLKVQKFGTIDKKISGEHYANLVEEV
jgi:hypothetical protein